MVQKALREFPEGFRMFVKRSTVCPFEVAIGLLAIWSGIFSLFDATVAARAFSAALPNPLVNMLNLLYILAGAFIVAGVGWGYRNIESSGLIFLFSILFIRVISLAFLIGFRPETTAAIVQGVIFGFACAVKLQAVLKRKIVISAKPEEIIGINK